MLADTVNHFARALTNAESSKGGARNNGVTARSLAPLVCQGNFITLVASFGRAGEGEGAASRDAFHSLSKRQLFYP